MAKRKSDRIIMNGLTDLVATMKVANTITGGSKLAGYDTLQYNNNYSLLTLNRPILTFLYSGNGTIQTAIDLPVQDALSRGVEINSPDMDADDIDELLDHMEQTDQWTKLRQAWSWGRLYGGAGLIINTNQEASEPLSYKQLYHSPFDLYDVDRWQLMSNQDLEHVDENNMFHLHGHKIHPSRVLTIKGRRAPYLIRRQLRGWGMSEAERMIPPLNNYLKTRNVLYEILDESKIDVYRMKGLAHKLGSG